MRILGIDPGSRSGWAFGVDNQPPSQWCHGWYKFPWTAETPPGRRFVEYSSWLADLIGTYEPAAVIYEIPPQRGGPVTKQLLGMVALIQMQAAKHNADCFGAWVVTLKKHATGHGGGKGKDGMLRKACELTGEKINIDDVADAICLVSYAFSLPAIPTTRGTE